MTEALIAALVVAALIWVGFAFNRLVRLRNRTRAGWSDIDVQLQRRHDLIPRLVESVQGYARFEQATLTAVTELRRLSEQAPHLAEKAAVEDEIAGVAHQLIALAEAYPDLKASGNFLALQRELVETEDTLQYARRFYNGAVREYNTTRQSFPDLIVAMLFAFREREFFAAAPGASSPVRVRLQA